MPSEAGHESGAGVAPVDVELLVDVEVIVDVEVLVVLGDLVDLVDLELLVDLGDLVVLVRVLVVIEDEELLVIVEELVRAALKDVLTRTAISGPEARTRGSGIKPLFPKSEQVELVSNVK